MRRKLFFVFIIMLALVLSGCTTKPINSDEVSVPSEIVSAQEAQVNKVLKLIYSGNQDLSVQSELKEKTSANGYQNLIATGTILKAKSCEKDFEVELSVKSIKVSQDSQVENVYNFSVTFSAKGEISTSDYVQEGQVTLQEDKGIWLIDNFYESTPDLYAKLSQAKSIESKP